MLRGINEDSMSDTHDANTGYFIKKKMALGRALFVSAPYVHLLQQLKLPGRFSILEFLPSQGIMAV